MPTPPAPPAELAMYIIGENDPATALEHYEIHGEALHDQLLRLVGDDWSFEGRRVLDFGCGSGRVLRQFLNEAEENEFHGCDIDAACIDWLGEHLSPPLHVMQSGHEPPLTYDDDYFDLIWATSVFSHLADAWSAWLLELNRVLKPHGILIVSVMGARFSESIASEPWDEERVGMNVLGYGRPWPAGGPMILHSEWWIRTHWGRLFEITRFENEGLMGQDAVVMRPKPVSGLTPVDLEEPEKGDPRELIAARHAISQLRRENIDLNQAHDAYASAYATETERREAAEARLDAHEGFTRRLSRRVRNTVRARASG